jgi:hypothetical protein
VEFVAELLEHFVRIAQPDLRHAKALTERTTRPQKKLRDLFEVALV